VDLNDRRYFQPSGHDEALADDVEDARRGLLLEHSHT
jgi:hypothetical protein